jgi:hypothetical protein
MPHITYNSWEYSVVLVLYSSEEEPPGTVFFMSCCTLRNAAHEYIYKLLLSHHYMVINKKEMYLYAEVLSQGHGTGLGKLSSKQAIMEKILVSKHVTTHIMTCTDDRHFLDL